MALLHQMIIWTTFLLCPVFATTTYKLESESYPLADPNNIQVNPSASNGLILKMTGLDTLLYELCVDSPIQFTVSDVRYSNTGNTGTIDIRIDDQLAWSYNTLPTPNSNTFLSSGSLGAGVYLLEGRYIFSIETSTTDGSGLKMDYVTVSSPQDNLQLGSTCSSINREAHIEIESFSGYDNVNMKLRSHASKQKSVLLFQDEILTFNICSLSEIDLTVNELVYSNDGNSDTITISIDQQIIESFTTISGSNGGLGWNNFTSSGQIGNTTTLSEGQHTVEITISSADAYGVELDYISFDVFGTSAIPDQLQCSSKVDIYLEAEEYNTEGGLMMTRTEASEQVSVRLITGQSLVKEICLRTDADIYFNQIIYSNDGDSDTIILKIDGNIVGHFESEAVSNFGNEWNNFRNAGISVNVTSLSKGQHTLGLEVVNGDQYGIELDVTTLTIDYGNNYITSTACPTQYSLLLEAEDFNLGTNQGIKFRRNASSGKTVYLKTGDLIKRSVCVTGNVKVDMKTIMLSNDGGSDVIGVYMQYIGVTSISTSENYQGGNGWNDIKTINIERSIFLQDGQYELEVKATNVDQYGVEIDSLTVIVATINNGTFTIC